MKIRLVGDRRAGGQTDMTKIIVAIRNFAHTPINATTANTTTTCTATTTTTTTKNNNKVDINSNNLRLLLLLLNLVFLSILTTYQLST